MDVSDSRRRVINMVVELSESTSGRVLEIFLPNFGDFLEHGARLNLSNVLEANTLAVGEPLS